MLDIQRARADDRPPTNPGPIATSEARVLPDPSVSQFLSFGQRP